MPAANKSKKPKKSAKKAQSKSKGKQWSNNGREKGYKNIIGNSFKDKPQNINKQGRPPKLLHHITQELKDRGYEPVKEAQIVEAYEMLLQLSEGEVKKIEKDKEKPFFLRLVARWMDSNRGMEMLDRIMDRSFGKVLQRQYIDANIVTEQPLFGEGDKK